MCFAPALANFALRFGPPEYFGLALMSFGLLTVFGGDEPIKTIVSTLMGCLHRDHRARRGVRASPVRLWHSPIARRD